MDRWIDFRLRKNFDLRILLINVCSFILTVIALLSPAIYNGFPLLHADSGTYILVGFETGIPVSRPITYCWFVRFSGFEFSLWLTIISQAVLLALTSLIFISKTFKTRFASVFNLAILSILSLTTGVAFYTSHIVPDFFLAVGLFSLCVLIAAEKPGWIAWVLLPILIISAGVVHLSNLPLLTAAGMGAIMIILLIKKSTGFKPEIYRYIILGITMVIAWLFVPKLNLNYGEGFKFSTGSKIVFTSRLFASGAMQEYIKDRCVEDSTFYLCKYVDDLDNYKRFDYFLWRDKSMLYDHECKKQAWDQCWRERDPEFGALNKEMLSHAKYRKIFYKDVVRQFYKALVTFNIIGYPNFIANQNMHYPIQKNFKQDYIHFKKAHQQNADLTFPLQTKIQEVMVILSLATILIFYAFRKLRRKIPLQLTVLLVMTIISVLVNALMIAYLAVVVGRFEGRMIWLFPFIAILLLYNYFRQETTFRDNGESSEQPTDRAT